MRSNAPCKELSEFEADPGGNESGSRHSVNRKVEKSLDSFIRKQVISQGYKPAKNNKCHNPLLPLMHDVSE